MGLNLNDLATKITKKEGKKVSMNIAQVKEVMKIVFAELAQMDSDEIEDVLQHYR